MIEKSDWNKPHGPRFDSILQHHCSQSGTITGVSVPDSDGVNQQNAAKLRMITDKRYARV